MSKHRFPRLDEALLISNELETSVEYLVTGSEPENTAERVLDDLQAFISNHRNPVVYTPVSAQTSASIDESGTQRLSNVRKIEDVFLVPLYRKTAAGKPIAIDSEPKGQVPVPQSAIKGDPSQVFAVEVSGNSMTEAGISDTDIAVFRRIEAVDSGKIALVRYQNESTIKRIKIFPDAVILCWEDGSGKMQTVDSEDYAIQGEFVGIFRK